MNLKLAANLAAQEKLIHWINNEFTFLSQDKLDNIKIALGEVVQNIIRHGYTKYVADNDYIEINYQINSESLSFFLRDYAPPCNPISFMTKDYSPSDQGHMGLSIIKKLTTYFMIKPKENGNETTVIFSI